MRVVIAPDAFKGSIGARDAAVALADGWLGARPGDEVLLRPMADGGEGTLAAFETAMPEARRMPVEVTGPDGAAVAASWLLLPDGTGVVELASTSGIELLGGGLRPLDASTIGFGQAIGAALDAGVERLVLAIGSSASTDGGAGVLTALGARLTDASGAPIRSGLRGLADLAAADASDLRPLPPGGVLVLSDVANPLVGPQGAAAVFGPQKGLDPIGVARAERSLARLAAALPHADAGAAGAGAAGGTGFALQAWGAETVSGAAEVARLIGLAAAIGGADLVVTGEGRFDASSTGGKAPAEVAALAAGSGVAVALVAGAVDADPSAFVRSIALADLAGSSRAALDDPARWLRAAGASLAHPPGRRASAARRDAGYAPARAAETTARASSCTWRRCSSPRSDSP